MIDKPGSHLSGTGYGGCGELISLPPHTPYFQSGVIEVGVPCVVAAAVRVQLLPADEDNESCIVMHAGHRGQRVLPRLRLLWSSDAGRSSASTITS